MLKVDHLCGTTDEATVKATQLRLRRLHSCSDERDLGLENLFPDPTEEGESEEGDVAGFKRASLLEHFLGANNGPEHSRLVDALVRHVSAL